jgi:hypothetical protein
MRRAAALAVRRGVASPWWRASWRWYSGEWWRASGLAAGGGRQSAIYATAGADVTVVDISPAMLELDRQVACRLSESVEKITRRGFSLCRVQEHDDEPGQNLRHLDYGRPRQRPAVE